MSEKKDNVLTEIANTFGVSTVTVSNALNHRKNVSRQKAEMIRNYAEKIGYRPSLLAKALKGKTKIIGLCLKETPEDPWHAAILKKLQQRFWTQGYFLSMFVAQPWSEQVIEGINFLSQLKADALIIGPLGFLEEYKSISDSLSFFDYVIAYDAIENLPMDHVKVDIYEAAVMAVDYLVSQGHQRIGMFGCSQEDYTIPHLKSRYAGFCDAMRRNGLPINQDYIYVAMEQKSNQIDREYFQQNINCGQLPTAFFCHNDNLAASAVKTLTASGLRVPDDISIIGVNNMPITELITPELTSIGFNLDQYVNNLVEMTIQGITKKTERSINSIARYIEPPQLIIRNSVKKIL